MENATVPQQPKKAGLNKAFVRVLFAKPWFSSVLCLVVLSLLVGIVNPVYFSMDNVLDVMRTASFALIIAAPLVLLFISGGTDLSLGAAVTLGGVVVGKCLLAGIPVFPSVLIAMAAGFAVGIVKAAIIMTFDLPPFIITLGLQYIINSIVLVWTAGMNVVGLPAAFKWMGQSAIFGRLYISVLIAAAVSVVFHVLLQTTKFGRAVCAVGGNRETAYLAGLNVKFYKYCTNIMVSVMAAFTGCVYASRFSSGITTMGVGLEMNSIASVVIGGTSMFGGSGTVPGAAIGCVLFAAIKNSLIMLGVPTFYQNMVFGVMLIGSIIIDVYRRKAATAVS